AAGWVRRVDPTRVVHYEGAIAPDWSAGHASSDLVCPMYPSIDRIVEWATTTSDHRPLIMCEYAHAMGNSCGNLADYWQAIESHHGLSGGFIWEMLDHGIVKSPGDPRPHFSSGAAAAHWAYGGDFGDEPHDGNFVCDGLFWPDRTAHPAMWEAKHLFQPFDAELLDPELAEAGRIRIWNKYDFRDLSHLRVTWSVAVDGTVVESGELRRLSVPAGGAEDLSAPWAKPRLEPGQEADVLLRFSDTTDSPLVGAGHEVGWVQLPLGVGARADSTDGTPEPQAWAATPHAATPTPHHADPLSIEESEAGWMIRGAGLEIGLRRGDGALTKWKVGGADLLVSGPAPNAWRAPTDNDGIKGSNDPWHRHQAYFRWLDAGLDRLTAYVETLEVEPDKDGRITVVRSERLVADGQDAGIVHRNRLVIASDGAIAAEHHFDVEAGLPDLPRIGVKLVVPAGYERLEWYGRGPHESYVDRKVGAALGRWQGSVDGQYVPYILPQEHGNKTDVRWIALRRDDGRGVLVSAPTPVEAKASHYSDATLGSARHTVDLVRDDVTYLTVDVRQRGLGGASCGPDTLERYKIPSGRSYDLRYALVPLRPADEPGATHRRYAR
ncbi:MAG TPA: glycoside hydrolase family 2 TIM barrel-domain containing protein, partial [Actinopolymorphaceae bacterium]|nr:glycoside hydrolase family 2 TIM barrel-domain containing protein [Actinopolymorphaceae bacterium]